MVGCLLCLFCFFFFKQKTAYEMRISDWSSDVCSSDLIAVELAVATVEAIEKLTALAVGKAAEVVLPQRRAACQRVAVARHHLGHVVAHDVAHQPDEHQVHRMAQGLGRSEEHTSELQSLMRISYAVFCLKKKKKRKT